MAYYIVTGAAGFIGSNLVKGLNDRGVHDIIAVDNLTQSAKFPNLVDCEIADYFDKQAFLDRLAVVSPAKESRVSVAADGSKETRGGKNVMTFSPGGVRGVVALVDGERAASI